MFSLVSSIRERSSDSSISESSIEIQTHPAPSGLIIKEPFKDPEEVEGTTPSNKMDLDQGIQVINPKARIPEAFPTGNNRYIKVSVQELVYGSKAEGVKASSKSLDRNNKLISSSEEVHETRKDRGTSEGWKPMSCKGKFQQMKA
ncbi:hypothetical protein O181_042446 [Austropuccinia psidii MF-1]|uniref:Uncharacterized protein n=1 Tax=Austropuccinia psidii MF-1 TaxID=1389203 RepID=A0A9Q3DLN0_9BASI|nr:hypothetical protein [Austropuccinia psidii MF-1]